MRQCTGPSIPIRRGRLRESSSESVCPDGIQRAARAVHLPFHRPGERENRVNHVGRIEAVLVEHGEDFFRSGFEAESAIAVACDRVELGDFWFGGDDVLAGCPKGGLKDVEVRDWEEQRSAKHRADRELTTHLERPCRHS